MTREVEHVAYSLYTELVVVEYGLDFVDDILVDDPRCGLLGISVGGCCDVLCRHIEQFCIEIDFALRGIVLTESNEEFVEYLSEENIGLVFNLIGDSHERE